MLIGKSSTYLAHSAFRVRIHDGLCCFKASFGLAVYKAVNLSVAAINFDFATCIMYDANVFPAIDDAVECVRQIIRLIEG